MDHTHPIPKCFNAFPDVPLSQILHPFSDHFSLTFFNSSFCLSLSFQQMFSPANRTSNPEPSRNPQKANSEAVSQKWNEHQQKGNENGKQRRKRAKGTTDDRKRKRKVRFRNEMAAIAFIESSVHKLKQHNADLNVEIPLP
jgi:hypothetical protein